MIEQLLILKKFSIGLLILFPIPNSNYLACSNPIFDTLTVQNIILFKAVKKLIPTMTMSPNLIPPFIVRDCARVCDCAHIFNFILLSSKFPGAWMLSKDYAVHKARIKKYASSFRSITIIPTFTKMFYICLHSKT